MPIDTKLKKHKERLKEIINQSFALLCNKIAGGSVVVNNEASLQMQFGVILNDVGQLYIFSPAEHFRVDFETPENISGTAKSKYRARCDIKLSFYEGSQSTPKALAYIEVKHFRIPSSPKSTEATSDNRFGVLMDIENLEQYYSVFHKGNCPKPLCYEIVLAENSTYSSCKRKTNYDIGNNVQSKNSYSYRKKEVQLKKKYTFRWEEYGEKQFWLKINIKN